jgi:DNA polymerase V
MNKPELIPLFTERLSAGFPSPAEGIVEDFFNLNELLVKNPAATFFVRVSGCSMIQVGIYDSDVLIVDRSLKARSGRIIVAMLNGEFTVKRLKIVAGQVSLHPENNKMSVIKITEEDNFEIWGVVTYVIHSL